MTHPPIHIRDDGNGPPVLFLHAFPLDGGMWDPQVAALKGHHRCLRPDFWGCGDSAAPPDDHGLDRFAAALLDQLARMGVPQFAVVGLSMGGYAAFSLLRLQPERITKVVFAATRATADSDAGRADRLTMARAVRSEGVGVIVDSMTSRLLSERGRADSEVAGFVRDSIMRCTPAGAAACQEAMAGRPDSTPLLTRIGRPALFVAGGGDGIIPVAEMETMAGLAGTRCHVMTDAGHLVNLESPAAFTDVVDDFLDGAVSEG